MDGWNQNNDGNAYGAQNNNYGNAYGAQDNNIYGSPYGAQDNNGYGNAYGNRFNQQDGYERATARDYWEARHRIPARCPGKEITAFVFGIMTLMLGGLSLLFFWNVIVTVVYLICTVSYTVVVFVLHHKVMMEAEETTKKIHLARVFAIVGTALCLVATIISIIVSSALFGRRTTPTYYSNPGQQIYYTF